MGHPNLARPFAMAAHIAVMARGELNTIYCKSRPTPRRDHIRPAVGGCHPAKDTSGGDARQQVPNSNAGFNAMFRRFLETAGGAHENLSIITQSDRPRHRHKGAAQAYQDELDMIQANS